ncbi:NAD(P)-binding domain-containing protein [Flammeovirgaceae bacterium SG7u.111]|nr:NAD(P)-binding domain-containing protein [Flammeovirgaceae bacterium SG7u.132]WPO33503.1 NAD(P)-binding domain-containing protein [Flammeovirgaceae bacterium SG7u.111]
MKSPKYDLIIIGAGPYGLSLATIAKAKGLKYLVLGKPLEFWDNNMPKEMILRSGKGWHIDPLEVHTFQKFLLERSYDDLNYFSKKIFIEYGRWFLAKKQLNIAEEYVLNINREDSIYQLDTSDNNTYISSAVVVAIGAKYFYYIPKDIVSNIPANFYSHTCHTIDFHGYANKRILVVGGRQSAFEWATLLTENGCEKVTLSYPSSTPSFSKSNWGIADELVKKYEENPNWYYNLSQEKKSKIDQSFWKEGRLKIEPWLEERLKKDKYVAYPNSRVTSCTQKGDFLEIQIDADITVKVDHILFATGYKVDIARIPFMKNSNIVEGIDTINGSPVLDENYQSNQKGLYFTGISSTKSMGLFFGFLIGVNVASLNIFNSIEKNL